MSPTASVKYVASAASPALAPRLRLVFWETTVACNLTCAHCRRTALRASRHQLSTSEACKMVDELAAGDQPVLVLSGGEALMRPDIFTIAAHAQQQRLPVALASNGYGIDAITARRLRQTGIRRVAISLDGASSDSHDGLRRLPGSFKAAQDALRTLHDAGISTQINCTITAQNVHEKRAMLKLAQDLKADALHFFLLVPVGCGAELSEEMLLAPAATEKFLVWMTRAEDTSPLQLKATCAPQAMRIRKRLQNNSSRKSSPLRASQHHNQPTTDSSNMLHSHTRGCLAGHGVVFVGHTGIVSPCGYLPLDCGNIREQSLGKIWQKSPTLLSLRNDELLNGPCGTCSDLNNCGGCRAQAYAQTGDYLGSDPQCLKALD